MNDNEKVHDSNNEFVFDSSEKPDLRKYKDKKAFEFGESLEKPDVRKYDGLKEFDFGQSSQPFTVPNDFIESKKSEITSNSQPNFKNYEQLKEFHFQEKRFEDKSVPENILNPTIFTAEEKKDSNIINSKNELMSEQEKQKFYREILLYFDENHTNFNEILTNIRDSKQKFDSTINILLEKCKIEKDQHKIKQAEIALITLLYATFFPLDLKTLIGNLVQYTEKDVDYVSKEVVEIIDWFNNTMGIDLKHFSIDSLKDLKIEVLKNKNIFDTTIMNSDKKKEIVEVNLKRIHNSFVIKKDSLAPPWDIVDHYYQKIQVCRHSIGSQFTRHNYLIKEKTKDIVILECKYCSERIEINDQCFMSRIKKRELWEADQNKRVGDITIYRFFWKKDKNNKWLSFPEMSYCGQTYDTAEQRCITNKNSHINAAMGITDNNMLLQHNIRNYKLELAQVVKRFKVEVLKVILFQGNWKALELIDDFNLREKLIQTAHYETEELADNFEKSMIAFFHSQFPEFGKNFEQGGRKPRNISLFNLKMVDDALQKVAFVSRRGGEAKRSFQKFLGLESNQRKIADNNVLYYFGRSFEEEINRRKYIFVDKLLRQGYKIKQIAQKFNDMTKDYSSIGINEQTVSKWISNKIYSDRFPRGYPAPEIRRLILEEELAKYIRQGVTDFYDLLEKFPAFNRKTIEEAVDELEKEGYNRNNITNRMIDLKRRHLLSNFFRPYGGFKKFIEKYSN